MSGFVFISTLERQRGMICTFARHGDDSCEANRGSAREEDTLERKIRGGYEGGYGGTRGRVQLLSLLTGRSRSRQRVDLFTTSSGHVH